MTRRPLIDSTFTLGNPPSSHLVAAASGRIRLPPNGYIRRFLVEPGPRDGELIIRVVYSYDPRELLKLETHES